MPPKMTGGCLAANYNLRRWFAEFAYTQNRQVEQIIKTVDIVKKSPDCIYLQFAGTFYLMSVVIGYNIDLPSPSGNPVMRANTKSL